MIRARFTVPADDPRPVAWPIKHPYWITGYTVGTAILVAYADDEAEILQNWPEAKYIVSREVDEYAFTSRFPKPEWFTTPHGDPMTTPDPTPTPTAPDSLRAALERLLKLRDNDTHALLGLDWHEAFEAARDALHAAALATTPPAPPLEPRACSCPTTPIVPPELIRALEVAEAALADIGHADREPGDDQPWAEHRAALDLPKIRHVLQTWREHATPPAPTLEAAPVPQQGAEISDRELLELMPQQLRNAFAEAARCCSQSTGGAAVFRVVLNTGALDYARAVWARAQAALPAADQQEGQGDA